MKILVVSQYFYPEQFRINDMCKEWVSRGHEVTVVTGIPNYPEGKFFDGYGWFKKRKDEYCGAKVIRIPLIARGNGGAIGTVLNYISFMVSGFFWKCFTRIKADKVFIMGNSPMTQALPGVWFAKKRKIPCCIYVQDLWPENVEMITGIHSPAVIKPIDRMVKKIYKKCDLILATSPSFVEEIRNRQMDGDDPSKVVYWPQYAEDFYKPCKAAAVEGIPEGGFKIAFTGNIGQAQGLDILPKAASLIKEKGTEGIKFVIVGDGRYKENLLEAIKENGVEDMFCFMGRRPAEDIPEILSACSAAFLSFADTPLFTKTIPAKLQSYMACGMPIIASADGETRRIIEEAKCGLCGGIGDAEKLAENIAAIVSEKNIEKMGENAREYFEKHFLKEKLMDKFELYLEGGKEKFCEGITD